MTNHKIDTQQFKVGDIVMITPDKDAAHSGNYGVWGIVTAIDKKREFPYEVEFTDWDTVMCYSWDVGTCYNYTAHELELLI